MKKRVQLTEKQYNGLEVSTRRDLIMQVFFIETEKHLYTIGAKGEFWTIVRYDEKENGEWVGDSIIVDKWI